MIHPCICMAVDDSSPYTPEMVELWVLNHLKSKIELWKITFFEVSENLYEHDKIDPEIEGKVVSGEKLIELVKSLTQLIETRFESENPDQHLQIEIKVLDGMYVDICSNDIDMLKQLLVNMRFEFKQAVIEIVS